eukprot:1185661-Prorocentrum_minimum.AAC.2
MFSSAHFTSSSLAHTGADQPALTPPSAPRSPSQGREHRVEARQCLRIRRSVPRHLVLGASVPLVELLR